MSVEARYPSLEHAGQRRPHCVESSLLAAQTIRASTWDGEQASRMDIQKIEPGLAVKIVREKSPHP
jgi:hypothetical protein